MLGNSGYPYIGAAEEKNTLYKYLKSISTDEEYAEIASRILDEWLSESDGSEFYQKSGDSNAEKIEYIFRKLLPSNCQRIQVKRFFDSF